MKKFIAMVLILTSPASGQPRDDAEMYNKAVDSVVRIGSVTSDWEESSGYGVVVAKGYYVTASALVESKAIVWAHAPIRRAGHLENSACFYEDFLYKPVIKCAVVATERYSGLALLEARNSPPDHQTPMTMTSERPIPGQAVFTIGGDERSVFRYRAGFVASLHAFDFNVAGGQSLMTKSIETTAPIGMGDSGGPLLNRRGELLGLNHLFDPRRPQESRSLDAGTIRDFLKRNLKDHVLDESGKYVPKKQQPDTP